MATRYWRDLVGSSAGEYRSNASREAIRWPESESAWREEYQRRFDAYHRQPYTANEEDGWHLFRAEDEAGNEIARTRRLLRDEVFIADQDAEALFGQQLSLELSPEWQGVAKADAVLLAGQEVLKRSLFFGWLSRLAFYLVQGRAGIEIVRKNATPPYGTILVLHDPRDYQVVRDGGFGTDITQVTIKKRFYGGDDFNGEIIKGTWDNDTVLNEYVRVLTPDKVRATLNGSEHKTSGDHGLGVVPFVNLVWKPTTSLDHGVHAAHGMSELAAMVDSLVAQIQAIGNRFADPKPYLMGARLGSGATDAGRFGRWFHNLPANATMGYLEPSTNAIESIHEAMTATLEQVRMTFPEFGLFAGGASLSGEAMRILEGAFRRKIESVRGGVLPGLGQAVSMALAMETGAKFNAEEDGAFTFVAGPVLPSDKERELGIVERLVAMSALTSGDKIRHAQRLGFVGQEHDPDEYAREAADEVGAMPVNMMTENQPGLLDLDDQIEKEASELRAVALRLDPERADPDVIAQVRAQILEVADLLAPMAEEDEDGEGL